MTTFLEFTIDKFTFKVAEDRLYTTEGLWAKEENGRVRIGLSDFVQQRSGDVAFAEVKTEGTQLVVGDEVAVIETIKVDTIFSAPLSGTITAVNPAMDEAPEAINEDPYGEGWLAEIEPTDWETDHPNLLTPEAYFKRMKTEAEEEAKR